MNRVMIIRVMLIAATVLLAAFAILATAITVVWGEEAVAIIPSRELTEWLSDGKSLVKPYVTKGYFAMEQAHAVCDAHGWNYIYSCSGDEKPGITGGCPNKWYESCAEIEQRWQSEGYAERAERERQEQEQRDLDFVRDVAKEGKNQP